MMRWAGIIAGLFLLCASPVVRGHGANTQTDNLNYAAPGPYAVGRTWLLFNDSAGNRRVLSVWYPAIQVDGKTRQAPLDVPEGSRIANMRILDTGGWGDGVLNAPPDTSSGPYPLVIFSPGYTAEPSLYSRIEEHLASYGFVVVSANSSDKQMWSHYVVRPRDTILTIDFAQYLSSEGGSFSGLIDTQHTAIVGHSSGGYTALAAAGAQINFNWFEVWCGQHDTSPDAAAVCPDLLTSKNDMLALANLDVMPDGLWPGWGDPRVVAVVSQSGDAYIFGPEGLASVTIPVMVQVGSKDSVNTPEWSAYMTYDNVSSLQKSLVVFQGRDHFIFGDTYSSKLADSINHFTTAFLLDMVKQDKTAHQSLLLDTVNVSDVIYKTTLK
ncbi:MAG: hypothetical protein R3E39_23220 [Anaerolineae bacterium]